MLSIHEPFNSIEFPDEEDVEIFEHEEDLEDPQHSPEVSLLDQYQFEYFERNAEFFEFAFDLLKHHIIDTDVFYALRDIRRPSVITADQVESGLFSDQGIHWPDKLKTEYMARERRLRAYTGYSNVSGSQSNLLSVIDRRYTNEKIFHFKATYTAVRPQLVHFQLRNLMCPLSKNNILYSDSRTIKKFNSDTGEVNDVLDRTKSKTALGRWIKISTMAASKEVAVAGGVSGQYVYKNLDSNFEDSVPSAEGVMTSDVNSITNHADIIRTNGALRAVFSCNDCMVRTLDLTTNRIISAHKYPLAINCTATSPDSKIRLVVGDTPETVVVDASSGKLISTLTGHRDYSFACAWSNDGYTFATGNQDMTCRVYDYRNTTRPLHIIGAQLGAIRSLRFDDSGKYMLMAEPVDFVHAINTRDFSRGQIIDFWGDIAGIGFSPYNAFDDSSLWIGVCDKIVGGLMQFDRWRDDSEYSLDNIYI
ncbi:WD40-repeat-containing domain protein [Dipodascopsis uninucleata]